MTPPHAGARYPLARKALPGLQDDIDSVPAAVAEQAMKVFVEVSLGTIVGQPLDELPSTGDRSDCFKVYVDTEPDIRPRYRLVYRLLPTGAVEAVAVELVAGGARSGLDAYLQAATRLGRLYGTP